MIQLSRSQLHDLYYYLRLNRAVDEQLVKLYRQGKEIRADVVFAEASPFPPPEDAARPVWA